MFWYGELTNWKTFFFPFFHLSVTLKGACTEEAWHTPSPRPLNHYFFFSLHFLYTKRRTESTRNRPSDGQILGGLEVSNRPLSSSNEEEEEASPDREKKRKKKKKNNTWKHVRRWHTSGLMIMTKRSHKHALTPWWTHGGGGSSVSEVATPSFSQVGDESTASLGQKKKQKNPWKCPWKPTGAVGGEI